MQQERTASNKQSPIIKNTTKRGRSSFFFFMSLVGLLAVLVGFAKTFIIPVAAGSFKAPFSIPLHGAASWTIKRKILKHTGRSSLVATYLLSIL
jgi:hypothetical protein